MKLTLKEQLIRGLLALGYREERNPTAGGFQYYHPSQPHDKYFVGPSGGLRHGPCISRSRSIGCAMDRSPRYSQIMAAGQPKTEAAKIAEA